MWSCCLLIRRYRRYSALLKQVWVGWSRPGASDRMSLKGPRFARNGLPRARSTAAVKPLRGSYAPLRPCRVTAAADRAGSPCGPAGRLALLQLMDVQHRGAAPLSRRAATADARGSRAEVVAEGRHPVSEAVAVVRATAGGGAARERRRAAVLQTQGLPGLIGCFSIGPTRRRAPCV